jgi:hypothetical protein
LRRTIERLRAIDNIFLVLAIGAAEYSAEHFIEHDERGVREDRLHLARENNQRRQSALFIEAREVRALRMFVSRAIATYRAR